MMLVVTKGFTAGFERLEEQVYLNTVWNVKEADPDFDVNAAVNPFAVGTEEHQGFEAAREYFSWQ